MKRIISSMLILGAISVVLGLAFCASPHDKELLKHYFGKVEIPEALYDTYEKLVKAFATGEQGNIDRFCLPHSVIFSTTPRPPGKEEYGRDINMPFLKTRFQKYIQNAAKRRDNTFLIRTPTTALFFVQIKNGQWRLYAYLDKPIQ